MDGRAIFNRVVIPLILLTGLLVCLWFTVLFVMGGRLCWVAISRFHRAPRPGWRRWNKLSHSDLYSCLPHNHEVSRRMWSAKQNEGMISSQVWHGPPRRREWRLHCREPRDDLLRRRVGPVCVLGRRGLVRVRRRAGRAERVRGPESRGTSPSCLWRGDCYFNFSIESRRTCMV